MSKYLISVILMINILVKPAFAEHPEGTIKVDIYGLVCDFCARALEKVFAREKSVDNINVDLDAKVVTIHVVHGQRLDDEVIRKYVTDAGYDIEGIRREG